MRCVRGLMVVGVIALSVGVVRASATMLERPLPLEGTRWGVKVMPDVQARERGGKPFNDILIFKDGKVTMSACVKYGYTASPYTLSNLGGHWAFKTAQVSEKDGQTVWTGDITGNAIKGTMAWTKTSDGVVYYYTFEGKKAGK